MSFDAGPFEGDLNHWRGWMAGPKDTSYEGGIFRFDMNFPADFPFRPPKIKFINKIYHPNINWDNGVVSLDILADQWCPAWTIHKLLIGLMSLLDDPNPNEPLSKEAAMLYKENRQ